MPAPNIHAHKGAIIAVSGIDKRFGAVQALRDARLTLTAGQVAAIVGENGAGKSTLAKIITGMEPRTAGEILLDGQPVQGWTRRQALAAGIGFVPQSLSLVPTLTITENHVLGQGGIARRMRMARRALEQAAGEIGVTFPLDVPCEDLSLAERQLGEIVSAVAAGARVLLLDEPTSSLGPVEVEMLIGTVRRLAAMGRAVGLVTHRVAEVMQGADHITVLNHGRVVMDCATKGLEAEDVARLMVGERDRSGPVLAPVTSTWNRLQVTDLVIEGEAAPLLDHVSLKVREGEILAVAGVSGAMQPALADTISGLRRPASGEVRIDGTNVTGQPEKATAEGLAYVAEDRSEGLAPGLSNAENASVFHLQCPGFRRFGMRNRAAETALGREVIAAYDVRPPDPALASGGLSGGNQQKLLVGREMARAPGVLVVHGPTQGLDLAAAAAIRAEIVRAATNGAAVLVISADLDELMGMAHRMIVLAAGRISAEFDLSEPVDAGELGRAMTGVRSGSAPAATAPVSELEN